MKIKEKTAHKIKFPNIYKKDQYMCIHFEIEKKIFQLNFMFPPN